MFERFNPFWNSTASNILESVIKITKEDELELQRLKSGVLRIQSPISDYLMLSYSCEIELPFYIWVDDRYYEISLYHLQKYLQDTLKIPNSDSSINAVVSFGFCLLSKKTGEVRSCPPLELVVQLFNFSEASDTVLSNFQKFISNSFTYNAESIRSPILSNKR